MRFPFEVPFPEVEANLESFVSIVFSNLESDFMTLPKGDGFVEYPVFEKGYETLKQATSGFRDITPDAVMKAVLQTPIILIVLRTVLGFTPPEWAYLAMQHTGTQVSQGFARSLDRDIRLAPLSPLTASALKKKRVRALVETACQLLNLPSPEVGPGAIHRLEKADTRQGAESVRALSTMGTPYAMLLYERLLGRPFAGHRDSVSELIGGAVESAIEDELSKAGISYRKTKRAEKVPGFDQTPDFIVPSEYNPQVVIEAKITEDDGTARDKVTRIQHLAELSVNGRPEDAPRFQVVACIAGRGFGVRRADMRKLLRATRGKVFTLKTLGRLVECTRLSEFRSA